MHHRTGPNESLIIGNVQILYRYCYAVDAKSDALFQKRMYILASCFPNVFIARKQFVVQRFVFAMRENASICATGKGLTWMPHSLSV